VRYSTSPIPDLVAFASATTVTGEPAPHLAGNGEIMTVTGLSPSTTYYFALRTSDEVPNPSALSNAVSATTTATSGGGSGGGGGGSSSSGGGCGLGSGVATLWLLTLGTLLTLRMSRARAQRISAG
jgi:uncharacterized membrane protein YgcG